MAFPATPDPLGEFHDSAQLVVPVAEDIGLDFQFVAENPLDWITAAVELGIELFNGDPQFGPPRQLKARCRIRAVLGSAVRHPFRR